MDSTERVDESSQVPVAQDPVPDESDSDIMCPICRCTIEETDPRVTTTCSHIYHFTCFMQMAQTSDTCSICRSNLYGLQEEGGDEQGAEEERSRDVRHVGTGTNTDANDEGEGGATGTDGTDVIEIEMTIDDIANLREQVQQEVQSRLSTARRNRQAQRDEDEEDAGVRIIDFEEDAGLRRSRMTFTIFQACDQGHLSRVRGIINDDEEMKHAMDDENNTLVHEAVFSDNEPLMRYLVNDLNLSTNSTNRAGMAPLHFAAFAKSARTASILLNCGAFVDPRDDAGRTPLMVACQKGDNAMCSVLLDRGASVRTIDRNGETALHHAARGKCLTCIRTLLRQPREDPNYCNFVGETPMHTACCAGSHTAVRFMLDNGGDPDIRSRAGSTPIDLVSRENSRLRSLIQRHSSV